MMKSIFRVPCVAVVTLLGVASCKQSESIEAETKVRNCLGSPLKSAL